MQLKSLVYLTKLFLFVPLFTGLVKGYETMQLGFGSPSLVVSEYVEHRVSKINTEVVSG